jgi:hypothetical protein
MTPQKAHLIDGKLVVGPRPLAHNYDELSDTNRATQRRRRSLTPVAHKAQRLVRVFSPSTMRKKAIQWLLARWRNA